MWRRVWPVADNYEWRIRRALKPCSCTTAYMLQLQLHKNKSGWCHCSDAVLLGMVKYLYRQAVAHVNGGALVQRALTGQFPLRAIVATARHRICHSTQVTAVRHASSVQLITPYSLCSAACPPGGFRSRRRWRFNRCLRANKALLKTSLVCFFCVIKSVTLRAVRSFIQQLELSPVHRQKLNLT